LLHFWSSNAGTEAGATNKKTRLPVCLAAGLKMLGFAFCSATPGAKAYGYNDRNS
jgi:hypothetical protein